jgi:drug/metabolite transporter (DMT)-like permease
VPIKYLLELLLLAAVWGASFIFMRTTAPDFGPIMLITLRTGIAAVFLLPFLIKAKLLSQLKEHWQVIFIVGLSNTAIPFCLFSYSTLYLGAGYASILNATAPMFGAIIGFFWLKDHLSNMAILGLFIGFCGVLTLSVARDAEFSAEALLPVFAALLATLSYGAAACYTKKHIIGIQALTVATGSQCFAFLCLAPLSLLFWPEQMPGLNSWLQVGVLGVVCTAFAYILYFRLIANIGSAKAITVAYLVPVFGVLWGLVFLEEHLSPGMWAGASLVILGVALTTGLLSRKSLATA